MISRSGTPLQPGLTNLKHNPPCFLTFSRSPASTLRSSNPRYTSLRCSDVKNVKSYTNFLYTL